MLKQWGLLKFRTGRRRGCKRELEEAMSPREGRWPTASLSSCKVEDRYLAWCPPSRVEDDLMMEPLEGEWPLHWYTCIPRSSRHFSARLDSPRP